jgi:hypothetical protein
MANTWATTAKARALVMVLGSSLVMLLVFARSGPAKTPVAGRAVEESLAHGFLGSYGWNLLVERGAGRQGSVNPCLHVVLGRRTGSEQGVFSDLSACGPILAEPIVFSNSVGVGSDEKAVLALAFPSDAHAVRVWLRGRASRVIPLRLVGSDAARKAGVTKFRYAPLPLFGEYCLERYLPYDAHERALRALGGEPGCRRHEGGRR